MISVDANLYNYYAKVGRDKIQNSRPLYVVILSNESHKNYVNDIT